MFLNNGWKGTFSTTGENNCTCAVESAAEGEHMQWTYSIWNGGSATISEYKCSRIAPQNSGSYFSWKGFLSLNSGHSAPDIGCSNAVCTTMCSIFIRKGGLRVPISLSVYPEGTDGFVSQLSVLLNCNIVQLCSQGEKLAGFDRFSQLYP